MKQSSDVGLQSTLMRLLPPIPSLPSLSGRRRILPWWPQPFWSSGHQMPREDSHPWPGTTGPCACSHWDSCSPDFPQVLHEMLLHPRSGTPAWSNLSEPSGPSHLCYRVPLSLSLRLPLCLWQYFIELTLLRSTSWRLVTWSSDKPGFSQHDSETKHKAFQLVLLKKKCYMYVSKHQVTNIIYLRHILTLVVKFSLNNEYRLLYVLKKLFVSFYWQN